MASSVTVELLSRECPIGERLGRDLESAERLSVAVAYFRDAVGMVMALLDHGGVGVFDPHMFKWWSADEWRERAFEPAAAVPHHHAVVLVSDEPEGRRWYHTRGMLKFGRPDLSVHHVAAELESAVVDLCDRFIEMQALGAVVSEGQAVKMASLPTGWRCSHRGDVDDPDFNNRHIDIGPGNHGT